MIESAEAGELSFATLDAPDVAERTLSAARAGSVDAFEEIVRHYDARLRALAYRILADRDAMDDAMQEAYVKAFRSLPRFSRRSSLGTWLYRVTYSACIDLLRRQRPSETFVEDEARDDPAREALSRLTVREALGKLPPDQRAVVVLVDVDGLSYAEVARIVGCPVGTVGSRLSRAHDFLRAALSGMEV